VIYPEDAPCKKCICQNGFNGKQKFCVDISFPLQTSGPIDLMLLYLIWIMYICNALKKWHLAKGQTTTTTATLHVAISIWRPQCTRIIFTLHKTGRGFTVKTTMTTTIWSKELNMLLSHAPVVLNWTCQKCNYFKQVRNYKRKPYYTSPTT
jgi:hypothetical protein